MTIQNLYAKILNCIIIATPAHRQGFGVVIRLFSSLIIRGKGYSRDLPPKGGHYLEWSDCINGQRERAKAWQECENEFFQDPQHP